ncbi:hypothetical protein M8756_03295 [Lutimaribacter sp. EGI FJ00015]|uniref:Uncharacterized protein n=1 Tax=Lutimaribacter degradans TaxID=2945989 RepID=A0ACC5ZRS1_9RHOB|nr:hypothetical protein [Lutimaribacter sp. EGI FJ00013]MCM2560731.1 hypothetical protein [Lutimaribacter sp. EGI FJ00013]MCO0612323.1 hypothetical protein [Lutimaribacter sp. EGI FJ00015]MCO0634556.1 hypothetical protein [Lutimaribacter sp. EGI FJ00014]
MPAATAILEIRRTTEITVEPEGIWALLEADRLEPLLDEGWPEERHLLGECVMLEGARAVGFGRVIWDAHTDDLPRVIDLAFSPDFRQPFFIETLEQELIAEYAADAEGGEVVRGHDGRLIDITRAAAGEGRHMAALGQRRPRA